MSRTLLPPAPEDSGVSQVLEACAVPCEVGDVCSRRWHYGTVRFRVAGSGMVRQALSIRRDMFAEPGLGD